MKAVRKASDLKFLNVGRRLQHRPSNVSPDNKLKLDGK